MVANSEFPNKILKRFGNALSVCYTSKFTCATHSNLDTKNRFDL